METRWLEDLVSLADTRSFRRSAQLRHVTQPAFSRRIRALEAWAGTELVDRSSYPMRLTLAGKTLSERAVDVLQALRSVHALMRGHSGNRDGAVTFAVPPVLACTFLPRWLACLPREFPRLRTSVDTMTVHDALSALVQRRCDVMIAYHHDDHPLPLDADRYETVQVGSELVIPYVKPDATGKPRFRLPGQASRPLPYLAYKPCAYLGGLMETVLAELQPPVHLDRIYEADMAECLKAMALEGHGIAFLPQSLVVAELRALKLVEAADAPGAFAVPVSIRAYREKPAAQRRSVSIAEAVWNCLVARAVLLPGG